MASVILRQHTGYKTTIEARGLMVISDEPIDDGGTNQGMEPTELLLAALGACAAITAKMYAQRKGWQIESIEIEIDIERYKARDYSAYTGDAEFLHEINQVIRITGDVTAEQKARLVEIAGKCPVHRILSSPVYMFERLAQETISQFD
jgi:putative redox protein